MEIRTSDITYSLRDNDIIEGRAIVFNSMSNVLYDPEKKRFFREVIAPEAVDQNLIDNSDIKFLINHNKQQMVARRKNGAGSLNVEWREDGVYFSFKKPNTTLGNDLYEMIQRGDLCSCSFAFVDGEVSWDFTDREMPCRTVKSIRALFDLSCVADPAYSETEINARSVDDMLEQYEKELKANIKDVPPIEELEKETLGKEIEEVKGDLENVKEEPVQEPENVEEERSDDAYLEELQPYKDIVAKL